MPNLDAAKAAFAEWVRRYEDPTANHDRRCDTGAALLEALHQCGVSAETRSIWSDGRRTTVELICFADNGLDFIAVFKVGAENCFMPKESFLRRFKPLVGDGARTDTARCAGEGEL